MPPLNSSIFRPYILLLGKMGFAFYDIPWKRGHSAFCDSLQRRIKAGKKEGRGNQKALGSWAISDTFQCALIQSIWHDKVSSFVVSFFLSLDNDKDSLP